MDKQKLIHQLFVGEVIDIIGAEKTTELLKEAIDAFKDIPDDKEKVYWHFECWDRKGAMQEIVIEALNEENATIIFKSKHEDLGFNPPY